mgnify:CR=1 FL=1
MKKHYALFINDIDHDTDQADWFPTLPQAIAYAQKVVAEEGADHVEIMAFDDDCECVWDDFIKFDEDGRYWSDDRDAREEMGCIQ